MHGSQYYNWCHPDDGPVTFRRSGRYHTTRSLHRARRFKRTPIDSSNAAPRRHRLCHTSHEGVTHLTVTIHALSRNTDQWRSKKLRSAWDPSVGRYLKGDVT